MKSYIGDGIYVEHDGHGLVLTFENGLSVSIRIVLQPDVFEALLRYVEVLKASLAVAAPSQESLR